MRYNYLVLTGILFLLLSCRKEEIILPETDYRDKLIGIYKGEFEFVLAEQVIDQVEILDNTKNVYSKPFRSNDKAEGQSITITKCKSQRNALIINGDTINTIPQSEQDKNNFSDIFLYTTTDCSGIESYQLIFYPEKDAMVLKHSHSKICVKNKIIEDTIFEGEKPDK